MTKSDKKGVDISQLTKEQEKTSDGHKNLDELTEENQLSHDELIEELQKHDPILAMLSAQIFDIGNVVGDLTKRVSTIERHLGYLLSKDEDIQKAVKESMTVSETAEDNNAEEPGNEHPETS